MQSSPRHQYQFDTNQFPFWLYRLSDKEYSQLRDHSFPIRIEALFLLKLALTRSNSSEELTLPKALVILEHEFGASSIQLDRWKQTFSFPLLLSIEKPNGLFYYLLRITDYRGGIEFDLFRIIDDIKYIDKDLNFNSQPIADEFSQVEIESVICYLWGFLQGFARHLDRWLEIKPFFRHVDSNHIIYGYWDGKFVEEQIDDLDEYDGIVQELETRYGEPKRSEPEKVANIQELIQSISQGVSHNSESAQPGAGIGSALSVASK
jgi:hypothetical protein